ncbi:glycosyl hydrolase [Botrimarina hoheduenensis]|uniref:Glycosyl hydrolase catalytic core n=1 Tax=Botrimarina hoheduenensis TaxID=2528000 RepID=A0A5C5WDS4_9BACT|nr:glycosyl hydrolase [Botrimarina hoheduenensis]TWT47842.1 Glycosyl hydrolase catalytic core [Botrimarina hoheduenensis]
MVNRVVSYSLAMLVLGIVSCVEAGSPKRGWAGSSALDHNASNASWYYRWWHTIPSDASGTLSEFIPLIKYPNNIQTKVSSVAALPNVDTLLVLNEPERPDQSNTTVMEALDIWPVVQAGLPTHKLVSPGVSDNAAGIDWLTDFMNEVELRNANANPADDLRVDAIAFHWYGASSPNAVSAANSFLNRVDWYHTQFNRPVWITEFAMHDWEENDPTQAMIEANAQFLSIVIPELESRSYVERYSYYNWFDDAMVFESPNNMPTVIGDQYVDTALPGTIRDLAGVSLGTDIGYLRGGEITNTGAALPLAMRALDALGGVSKISGVTDWSLSDRRDTYTRVRPGATLRKTGSNTINLTGVLELDGNLEVIEGVLSLQSNSPSGTGGAIRVKENATLQIVAGRNLFTVAARPFQSAGTVEGAIRFSSGASVTADGPAPTFTSNVTVEGSVFDIGGAGFTVATSFLAPVTTQLRLDYDAANDAPGDNLWNDATGSADSLTFGSVASPITVADSAFPGVTAAYLTAPIGGASGLNQFFEGGGPRSRQDATFEVVFRVDNAAAGSDQVLLEVGGAARGVAFVLNNNQLTFNVDGDGNDINLTTAVAQGWNHAVGVIDLETGGDSVTLFINGQAAGTLSGQSIVDWSGGNLSGLGAGSSSATGVSSGLGAPFHGAVANARYYENYKFSAADALQNYEALTTAPLLSPTEALVQGTFSIDTTSELRLDLGDAGAADKLTVDGAFSVVGTALSVNYVGQTPLAAGNSFDLFDYTTANLSFGVVTLPTLDPTLRWRLDGLMIDGSIQVVLAGDLNADGFVDIADYTVWRDSLDQSVTRFTAGDSNGDGLVDQLDLAEWQNNYGASLFGTAQAVPEPGCLGAILATAVAFMRGRRR